MDGSAAMTSTADFEASSLLDLNFSDDDSAYALSGGDEDDETSKHDAMSRGSASTARRRRRRAGSVGSAASSTLYSQATGGPQSSARSGRASDAIARRTRARNPMLDKDFDQIDMVAYDHLADWEEGGDAAGSETGTVDSKDVRCPCACNSETSLTPLICRRSTERFYDPFALSQLRMQGGAGHAPAGGLAQRAMTMKTMKTMMSLS